MAEREAQRLDKSGKYMVYLWEGITASDTGEALAVHDFDDLTIYVFGTFDGASIGLSGCPTKTGTFLPLRDMLTAAAIAVDAAGVALVADGALFVKPVITGGTTVDLDVYLVAK